MKRKAAIRDISYYLPEIKLTNEQLAQEFQDWSIDKIFEKTGIAVRHIAAPDECASDLAFKAAEQLLAKGSFKPEEIDFLLFSYANSGLWIAGHGLYLARPAGLADDHRSS